MSNSTQELRARLAELVDLRNAAHVLGWDQQTMMPPRGAAARAESLATLERLGHDFFVSDETGRLIEAAESELNGQPDDSDAMALIRVTRRRWEKARRVPTELAADLARAGSIGQEAWVAARRDSDFSAFAPYLKKNLALAERYVDCFDGFDCRYDVLLDNFDPGMKTAKVSELFTTLKAQLRPLIETVAPREIDTSCLHIEFPRERQRELALRVIKLMGFTHLGWRMDDAVHPFATSFGSTDVRITTRWDENFFPMGLFGAMHECGHGLYEEGVAETLQRTPLGYADSLSLHESQSRLWENMVGRGKAFSSVLAPIITELSGHEIGAAELFCAVNRIQPSLIRVEADEATYALHIVLRFELEQELIDERLTVEELPEAWNARFRELLGIEVPDDAHGVLQDVHWSAGLMGYFPTYALGNLIAASLWAQVHRDIPDLEASIAAGDLAPLRDWLRENVHRHGAKFTSAELLARLGADLSVEQFAQYLRAKASEAYEIAL